MYADTLGIEKCPGHTEIIEILSKQIEELDKSNQEVAQAVRYAFIFFVAHISENKDIHIPEHLYIQIITELLQFHHKMLSLKFKSAEITARVGS